MNNTPIWYRQPYETDAAFNAFHEFYLVQLHPRSVDEAYRQYKGYTEDKQRRAVLSFRRWSQGVHKDGSPIDGGLSWQKRTEAYDDHLAELREAEFEKHHMGATEALALLAMQARGSLGDFGGVQVLADLEDHPKARLVKALASDVYEDKAGKVHYKARIELHDAQSAIINVLKVHGKFKETTTNLNLDLSQLTNEQLQRIAAGEEPASVLANPTQSGG